MAQVTKRYCDFCGKDITDDVFWRISGDVIGTANSTGGEFTAPHVPHLIAGSGRNPELCQDCFSRMKIAAAPFVLFIDTKGGRVKPETKEAAHE